MAGKIVPLYWAAPCDFVLSKNPYIAIEPWKGQIKHFDLQQMFKFVRLGIEEVCGESFLFPGEHIQVKCKKVEPLNIDELEWLKK